MRFGYYDVERREEGIDAYGQPLNSFVPLGKARLFICIKSNKEVNDPRFADTTHIGLAQTGSFELGDKIIASGKSYIVRLINNEHSLTQLFLKEE